MILVTGATGHVGHEVAEQLTAQRRPLRCLVRVPAAASLPPAAEAVAGDLNHPASLRPALDGVTGVFLLPGFPDMPGLLTEMRRAGVTHVVLLSSIAAPDGDLDNAISAMMIDSENAVRSSGLHWTILRPSGFMSNTFEWTDELVSGDTVRAAFPAVPVAMIDPADIGAVAARVLLDPSHYARAYSLSGPQALLPADRVRILGQVLGRPLRFEGLPDSVARREMVERGIPEPYIRAFFRYYADGTLDDSRVHTTVRELLNRPPRTFEQWAQRHAAAFRRASLTP